jgi:hypothetical protein
VLPTMVLASSPIKSIASPDFPKVKIYEVSFENEGKAQLTRDKTLPSRVNFRTRLPDIFDGARCRKPI